ncbi:Protein CBG10666 [Caenorhabditis briggsae]|uniref:Protein CBG10666 n=1 Tax=Caenorhabditis briggsae TaxID=6238 RepID=G2J6P2_CAEBR|nr:Protein CBG10681 [Caenorhabditis briggsae]XP_045094330.1 Protein CBG10666 [Caenorhabditis briggsae]CAP30009.2 Protein CBG10666 [Caenorhabditis briggsae]CAP30017.1 Protein CBG10681 [Caenorhabditis briggsae]
MTKGNDCVLEHVDNSKFGYPSSDMWNCYCFSDMCNYPFTFKEFERRGHTLKPTFAMGSD